MTRSSPRFRSIVLDVDSTVAGIEGIDWLAERRGADVARQVAAMTDRAMRGEIALDAVYGERLALIRPTRAEIDALGLAYRAAVAPGAAATIGRLQAAGVRVVLVSGGLREAILPLARDVGVSDDRVHAVGVRFDEAGGFAGFERESPLATQGGKPVVVARLALPAPVLAVGDGSTDVAMRAATAAFAAYTGFVRRDAVVGKADHVIDSFARLEALVLP
jgi:phosphoserine phosphatase